MNTNNTFYKGSIFFYYCVLLLILSTVGATENEINRLECSEKDNDSLIMTKDVSCQVDAYTAYLNLKIKQTLLVDIRSHQKYQKISIPNSINVPLHTLKTKNVLKTQRLFLIDDGGRLTNIPLLCSQLKQKGFDVSYVTGGINAWSKLKKNLIGKPEELVKIDELGPEHFYFDSLVNDILIINMGTKKNQIIRTKQKINPFISYFSIPLQKNSQLFLKKLKSIIKRFPQVSRLFIYDDDGKNYQSVKHLLQANLKPSVFYLRGGYQEFIHFDLNHLALLKKKQVKPNQFFSCRG
jgi:rhodanese-related sulfurtransferase